MQKICWCSFWNREEAAVLGVKVLLNDLEQELEQY